MTNNNNNNNTTQTCPSTIPIICTSGVFQRVFSFVFYKVHIEFRVQEKMNYQQ